MARYVVGNVGGRVMFAVGTEGQPTYGRGDQWDLWTTNGTAAGSKRVVTGAQMPVIAIGGTIFHPKGRNLWSLNAATGAARNLTTFGARRGLTIPPYEDYAGTNPYFMPQAAGGRVFFSVSSPTYGKEVWSTDGRRTAMVKDFTPGRRSTVVTSSFDKRGPYVYFTMRQQRAGGTLGPERGWRLR